MRCLTRIPEMVSSRAVEPEPLIAPMIALLASNNAEVKRRVCDFLCVASEADEEVNRISFNLSSSDNHGSLIFMKH